ncbi:nucleotide exchange factor GrpE [Desulfotalea psychrophila]|uniref:Protein GrpE n=1 Tax=Desulfotalea psychrophila (strain LSv54 / DSM 12343) TaxID=177439 RepID=Q6AMQ4_DESPS|nr:nucleotide exchange factor GrpE [Desulfotalea psychrophila]CAG36371.1 related to GrpE protein (HSP-70 cofactor) [Desulfotalea psychrophila LSv54]
MNEKVKKEELKEEQEGVAEELISGVADSAGEEVPVEKTLEEQLAEAKAEVAQLHDSMLRMAAESENFKKRIRRESLATLKYAGENIFKVLLPAVDNLERAVAHAGADGTTAEQGFPALREGVELTLKSLVGILEKFEVKAVDSLGVPFDPAQQEALTMEPSETVPANHVTTVFEKGYYYKDRLLRPAKVVVSSGVSVG